MSKNNEQQTDTIDRKSDYIIESFDLDRMDSFVTSLGVEFLHYKVMPSPIGQNDRSDLRKNEVDTISSNGNLYRLCGKFTATMTDNSKDRQRGEAGILDPSESRLVMPRFYNDKDIADGKRIYVLPGDRIYVSNPNADVLVSNTQKMDFVSDSHNIPMFPIVELELPIVDSRNVEYKEGVDFKITKNGNICWLDGGRNPGIDPDTGKGRVYSVRYLYKAYWYITQLIKEVRVTNITTDGQRNPERMPYFVVVQREYMYHNQNKGDQINQLSTKEPQRTVQAPSEQIPSNSSIVVDMTAFSTEDGQS